MVDIKEPVLGSLLSPNLRPLKSKLPPWSRYLDLDSALYFVFVEMHIFSKRKSHLGPE